MKSRLLPFLLFLTAPLQAEPNPAQPPALHALSPEAENRLAEASRAAAQDKNNQPALDLLEEDDPSLVAAAGALLAEHLKPEDLALEVRRAMEEEFPQRHLLPPLLVLAPSAAGTNFLVNQLGATEDPSQQKMIRKLLTGITGQNFQTPAEWTAWWDKACATFAPAPLEPYSAGEKFKALVERLDLAELHACLSDTQTATKTGSVAAHDLFRTMIGHYSAGVKAVEDAPRTARVMDALTSFRQGDFGEADAALSRHLDQSPRDVYALFLRAAARMNKGNHGTVEDDLTLLLRLDPSATSARLLLEYNRILARQPRRPLVEAYWQAWHQVCPKEKAFYLGEPIQLRFQGEQALDLPTYQHPGGGMVRRQLSAHASDPELATGFALLLPKNQMLPALDEVLARHPRHDGTKRARLERLLDLDTGNSEALLELARSLLIEDPGNLLLQLCVVEQEWKRSLPEGVWSKEFDSPMPSNSWKRLVAVAEGNGRWPTHSKALQNLQRQAARQAGWVFLEIPGTEFLHRPHRLSTLFTRAVATVRNGCPMKEALAVARLAERVAEGIRGDRNRMMDIILTDGYVNMALEIKRLVAEQGQNKADSARLAQLKSERSAKYRQMCEIAIALPEERLMPLLSLQQAFREFRQTRDPFAEWKAYEEFRKSLSKQ